MIRYNSIYKMQIVCTAFVAMSSLFLFANPEPSPKVSNEMGMRLDCLHDFSLDKGSRQECLRITSLYWRMEHAPNSRTRAFIQLNPFGTPWSLRKNSSQRADIPSLQDARIFPIDSYGLIWRPRPQLKISLEDYQGAALFPSTSGLAAASPFADAGWEQTALTLTYELPPLQGIHVHFAAGNGEGEIATNLDPQQYFGFRIEAGLLEGVKLGLGMSMDANSAGSYETTWHNKKLHSKCFPDENNLKIPNAFLDTGHSTQRMALGLEMDGRLAQARGLKLGLGWMKISKSDLNKESPSVYTMGELSPCSRLDLDHFFVEDESKENANTVDTTVTGINGSYRILDTYFLGFDYQRRVVDAGSVFPFQACEDFSGSTCNQTKGDPAKKIIQTALSFGLGVDLESNLHLVLEYGEISYDDKYNQFHFAGRDNTASKSRDFFNGRVSYNL